MSAHFQLHGLRLGVDSDDSTVQDLLRRTLRYKGAEALTADDSLDIALEINVGRSLQSQPEAARHVGTSAQCGIEVCDARENFLISRDGRKNDVSDAYNLCRLLRLGELQEVYQSAEDRRAVFKATAQHYLSLRKQQVALKQKMLCC